jgi:hypothetical protein
MKENYGTYVILARRHLISILPSPSHQKLKSEIFPASLDKPNIGKGNAVSLRVPGS